ncbi:MAG: OmpA family protein [Pseudomonadota bacterium]
MPANLPLKKRMKYLQAAPRALGLAAVAAFATPVLAQDAPWYLGANVGRSSTAIDDGRIRSGLAGMGLATSGISDRDHDTGYKLFGGYRFSKNIALEAGWFDLGRFGYTASTVPAGTLGGDIRVKGLNLDLVGTLPLTNRLSVLARAGITNARSDGRFGATGAARVPYASTNPSQRATNYKFGAGLAYDFSDTLGMRVEAERFRISDAVGNKGNIDLLSVGLVYRFGATAQRPPAYEPVAIAPASMPPAVRSEPVPLPPPAPASMKLSLSADALFDFDRATLKPAGKQALDKLAADLRGTQFDTIRVTGHTDRLGPHAYNLELSAQRAEVVGAYLADSAGIAQSRISTRGVDGADPVTRPGDCVGNNPTPALIACLQPDRRVEIQVEATATR